MPHGAASIPYTYTGQQGLRGLERVEGAHGSAPLQGPRAPWVHTDEGDDDMPAHVKSSMFGCSLTIPITNGHLNLGTWQARGYALDPGTLPLRLSGRHALSGFD